MPKMRRRDLPRNLIRASALALVISLTGATLARAAECPRKDMLGTSRTLAVDAVSFPRVGLKSFPQTLPLRDHEVVLTLRRRPVASDYAEDPGRSRGGVRVRDPFS